MTKKSKATGAGSKRTKLKIKKETIRNLTVSDRAAKKIVGGLPGSSACAMYSCTKPC